MVPPFRSLLRFAVPFGVLALAASLPTSAQTAFRLVEPVLLVDGQRVAVNGAPVQQRPFGYFILAVPDHGTYVVADRPFEGARRSGQFDGPSLAFTAEGRNVRLRAAEPILDTREPAYAYVRLDPAGDTRTRGPALVSLSMPSFTAATVAATVPAAGPSAAESMQPAGLGNETEAVVAARRERDRLASEIEAVRRERETLHTQNATLRTEIDRMSTSGDPLVQERERLRSEIAHLTAQRDQALQEQARLAGTRQRLEAETAQLERDLATYAWQVQLYETERARLERERERLARGLNGTRQEMTDFTDAVARLEAERTRLVAERHRLDAERARLASDTASLRHDVQALDAETGRLTSERDRLASEQGQLVDRRDRLQDEQSVLREQVRTLRTTTEGLEEETRRLSAEQAMLTARQARLATERDRLQATLDAQPDDDPARSSSGPAGNEAPPARPDASAVARLTAERDAAFDERDGYAVTTASLRREIEQLQAHIRGLETEVNRLTVEEQRLYGERDQLVRERDALHREAERLRNEHGPASTGGSPPVAPPMPATDGPSIRLPGFDWSRLQNPGEVRRLLLDAAYPAQALQARAEGDVLVLFVTDDTGRVVEATVAEALGHGLDAVAERLVRAMHFVPAVWDGMRTVLRSQVVVRFDR